jgi:transcriptional regulator with PAS, ATPase and Fis domain
MLVEYFIDRYSKKAGKKISTIEKRTVELLKEYHWPGNIRELQNIIERSVVLSETGSFSVDPSWLYPQSSSQESRPAARSAAQDAETIEAALARAEGRISGPLGAATALGIPASTLESRIRALKINKYRFKKP